MDFTKKINELVVCGQKIVAAGLVAGAGGNISVRCGNTVYVKPSGFALDELKAKDYVGVDIKTGKIVSGKNRPTCEVIMHLSCYRNRPDIVSVVHTHSPWATGVISSGQTIKPMFAEFIYEVESIAQIPYLAPGTPALAKAVGKAVVRNNAVLMENHGVVCVAPTVKLAYYRALIIEDAAKSLIAATIAGKPKFLSKKNISDLKRPEAIKYRQNMLNRN